jgi:hypothetical protein
MRLTTFQGGVIYYKSERASAQSHGAIQFARAALSLSQRETLAIIIYEWPTGKINRQNLIMCSAESNRASLSLSKHRENAKWICTTRLCRNN